MADNQIKLLMSIAGVERVNAGLRSVAEGAQKIGAVLASVGAAIGAAKLATLAHEAIEAADAAGKMSQKVGVAVEQLTALQYAAKLSDVDVGTLQVGLRNLAEELQKSGKSSADFYAELLKVADKFAAMPDGIAKTAEAQKLFGRSGLELIPLLNQGADAIRKQADEARDLGVVIGSDLAAKAEVFNDNLTRLKTAGDGFWLLLAERLLPTLVTVSDQLVRMAKAGDIARVAVDGIASGVRVLVELANNPSLALLGPVLGGKLAGDAAAQREFAQAIGETFQGLVKTAIATQETTAKSNELSEAYTKLAAKLEILKLSGKDLDRAQEFKKFNDINEEIQKLSDSEDAKRILRKDSSEILFKELAEVEDKYRREQLAKDRAAEAERNRLFSERVRTASTAFGNIADAAKVFGKKGHAVYKAAAIAQTTIDTYTGATAAYKSLAGIPYVGPFLGAAAAAAAIAAGVANIARISSTNPGFMAGGYTGDGPRTQVAGTVHRGEYVVNAPTVARVGLENLEAMSAGSPSVSVGGPKISNIIIPDVVGLREYLKSRAGQDEIVNIVRSNRMAIGMA